MSLSLIRYRHVCLLLSSVDVCLYETLSMFKFFTSNSLLRFSRMKFRKKGSLSFKLSRNISRVTSLKSVLNINIEGTRARRKFRHEDTRARQHRRHAENLGTRARGHANIDGTRARQNLRMRARGHEGTPTWKA